MTINMESPKWDDEALKKIEKAPFFVRKLAKSRVEKAAIANGVTIITAEFVEQVRQKQTKH